MSDVNELPSREADATKPAPPAFVDNGRPRFRTVPLEWPIAYDGKTYTEITVRRMTGDEVANFVEQAAADAKTAKLPMFEVPQEVIASLDADDAEKVNDAVNDFLPRALRAAE